MGLFRKRSAFDDDIASHVTSEVSHVHGFDLQ